jgi:hypothetical protein
MFEPKTIDPMVGEHLPTSRLYTFVRFKLHKHCKAKMMIHTSARCNYDVVIFKIKTT